MLVSATYSYLMRYRPQDCRSLLNIKKCRVVGVALTHLCGQNVILWRNMPV